MIHYHGTPIGGSRQDTARFLIGRHALVPFPRPDDMPIVADVCQSFVLDNGAYSIWKQGGIMDYDGYVSFVRKWCRHPNFDWAIIPDVVEGSEEENDEFLKRWPRDIKGVPVYHIHEDISRLIRLAGEYEIVALGSSGIWKHPGSDSWWIRMTDIMNKFCDQDGSPICKLHGLRMLDPKVFSHLPLSSADSTNAGRNNNLITMYGKYVPPTTAQRSAVIADRIEMHNSSPIWSVSLQQNLFEFDH